MWIMFKGVNFYFILENLFLNTFFQNTSFLEPYFSYFWTSLTDFAIFLRLGTLKTDFIYYIRTCFLLSARNLSSKISEKSLK